MKKKDRVNPCPLDENVIRRYGIFIFWSEEDDAFISVVPELKGCMAHGDTYEEALRQIRIVIPEWLAVASEAGWELPKAQGARAFRAL